MPYDTETDEAIDEMFESDESIDEADAAARSWTRPARPRVASGKNLYTPRPQTQYVTQAQLQTALAKVGSQVSTNSRAISQVGGRIASISSMLNKETGDRKKDITGTRNSLTQISQMAAILPLLTQPKSVSDTDAGSSLSGQNVLVDSGNSMNLLLPLLLMSSVGDGNSPGSSSGNSGGLFGTGDNSTLLMLALVLGLGKN
jgi:hypothetical protein